MSFEITGKLYEMFDEQQVTASFRKREFVLEIQDGNYAQYPKFQLVQDKCGLLDSFKAGDEVKVSFNLQGRKANNGGYFTNLGAWKVEPASGGGNTGGSSRSTSGNSRPAERSSAPSSAPVYTSGPADDDELPF